MFHPKPGSRYLASPGVQGSDSQWCQGMQLLTPSGWLPTVSLENVFVAIRSESLRLENGVWQQHVFVIFNFVFLLHCLWTCRVGRCWIPSKSEAPWCIVGDNRLSQSHQTRGGSLSFGLPIVHVVGILQHIQKSPMPRMVEGGGRLDFNCKRDYSVQEARHWSRNNGLNPEIEKGCVLNAFHMCVEELRRIACTSCNFPERLIYFLLNQVHRFDWGDAFQRVAHRYGWLRPDTDHTIALSCACPDITW